MKVKIEVSTAVAGIQLSMAIYVSPCSKKCAILYAATEIERRALRGLCWKTEEIGDIVAIQLTETVFEDIPSELREKSGRIRLCV